MEGYRVVFRGYDETTANIVKSALRNEGIDAVVRPLHTSWLDGALVPAEGYWGEVFVPEKDAERASALIAEYQNAQTEAEDEVDETDR